MKRIIAVSIFLTALGATWLLLSLNGARVSLTQSTTNPEAREVVSSTIPASASRTQEKSLEQGTTLPVTGAKPSSTPPGYQSAELPAGWRTLKNGDDKFQVSYPPNWIPASNISDASNPSPARDVLNLVSGRLVGGETQTVTMVIAVYDAPSTSIVGWLNQSYQTSLADVEKGGIDEALSRAYAGEDGVVSTKEFQNGQTSFYELGSASPSGLLVYATYLQMSSSPYVYAIEIHLLPAENTTAEPSDIALVEQYKQIVSEFKLLK